MPSEDKKPADYIVPLTMNKLRGRMLRMPAPVGKKREILFVYGHHSTIERWWGVAQVLNQYGAVTMPDLPGFGGMQSFYRIDEKPTLDAFADYLAAFVKLRYKRRRVTIVGMSFGMIVVTRMLQRYPDLASKIDLFVSVAGFAHHEDFIGSRTKLYFYRGLSKLLYTRPVALFFRNVCLHPTVIRLAYTKSGHIKFADLTSEEQKKMVAIETTLWHKNDVRTHWSTMHTMLTVDNCKTRVDLPVWHVGVSGDQYFDKHRVEQHLKVIFSEYHGMTASMKAHAPSVIADVQTALPLFPPKLRYILSKQPN